MCCDTWHILCPEASGFWRVDSPLALPFVAVDNRPHFLPLPSPQMQSFHILKNIYINKYIIHQATKTQSIFYMFLPNTLKILRSMSWMNESIQGDILYVYYTWPYRVPLMYFAVLKMSLLMWRCGPPRKRVLLIWEMFKKNRNIFNVNVCHHICSPFL